MKFVTFFAVATSVAQAADHAILNMKHHVEFVNHVKKYDIQLEDHADYKKRHSIYSENVKRIKSHNLGNHTYTLGENQFTHLTFEEFAGMYLSKMPERSEGREVNDFADSKAADSVDWSTTDAVTDVKDQGQCGSCWAFSTTGAMEGAYFVKNGEQLSFSEQQLVSCDKASGDMGCNGGLMDQAFSYIAESGLCSESDYPYTSGSGNEGTCQQTCQAVDGTKGLTHIDVENSEDALAKAVTQQPVAVAVDANWRWQFYKGGVLTHVKGDSLDHGVLLVGFGTSDRGIDFWKIKNSWNKGWGEQGYIRIARNVNQQDGPCGITAAASYPTLA